MTNRQQGAMTALEETAQSLIAAAHAVGSASDYEQGRLMGYYEALSTLLNQCDVMGIAPTDLHLGADFSAEAVLAPLRNVAG